MIKLLLAAALVGIVYSANTACWDIDRITDEVMTLGDTDGDGELSMTELLDELLMDWNLGNDSNLHKHDFVSNWVSNFHDHHSTANTFFDNIDGNGDGILNLTDILPIILNYDANADGIVQEAELRAFMHATHPDSTAQGGHGHGCH